MKCHCTASMTTLTDQYLSFLPVWRLFLLNEWSTESDKAFNSGTGFSGTGFSGNAMAIYAEKNGLNDDVTSMNVPEMSLVVSRCFKKKAPKAIDCPFNAVKYCFNLYNSSMVFCLTKEFPLSSNKKIMAFISHCYRVEAYLWECYRTGCT